MDGVKRRLLLIAGLLFWSLALSPLVAVSHKIGAPGSSTGAPISSTLTERTCTSVGCHDDGAVNTGSGSVQIMAPAEYTPGVPLDIVVRVEETEREVFGFQVAAKAASTTDDYYDHEGRLELIDSTTTRLVADHYVTHMAGGVAQQEWSVRWVPPEGETRDVTVYAAGNAANGDGSNRGDHIYTMQRTMRAAIGTATAEEPALPGLHVARAFPNPFVGATIIRYTIPEKMPVTIVLYDALGRQVQMHRKDHRMPGTHTTVVDAHDLGRGLYFLEVRTPRARRIQPLIRVH